MVPPHMILVARIQHDAQYIQAFWLEVECHRTHHMFDGYLSSVGKVMVLCAGPLQAVGFHVQSMDPQSRNQPCVFF